MKYLLEKRKEIFILFITFWIVPFIMFFFSLMDSSMKIEGTVNIYADNFETSVQIMKNNLFVCFLILLIGLVFKYAPMILYFYNSVLFSITFLISLNQNGLNLTLTRLLPHAFLEVFGLASFVILGIHLKNDFKSRKFHKGIIFTVVIIIIAAFLESYISKSIIK